MNLLEALFCLLAVFMFVPGLLINYGQCFFPESFLRLFRYGRANISKIDTSSSLIEVPKRWFYHFYLYAVMLQFLVAISIMQLYFSNMNTSWVVYALDIIGNRSVSVSATATMIAVDLFLFHLCRRLYETLYVSVFSNTKMNVLHYLLGYIHYTGAIFCLVAHSPNLTSSKPTVKIETTLSDIGVPEICGIVTFLLGNYLQHRAHVGLANLRKGKDKVSSGHKIPRGELFEYISNPNYFAEILIYCALAGLFGFKNSSWNYCTIWVISNQIVSGIMNHIWYIKTFKDYPKQRKAIIPFVW